MRLVTRSDFDGLVCAVLLKERGLITEYKFAHPKDLQDGLIEVTDDDILANVPYVKGCGMWFDHHTSETERVGQLEVPGDSRPLPSCARVIWEYYAGHKNFSSSLDPLLDAVDKVDSGQLSRDDIENPQGWVLLGFIMDPRTGLGRYRDYRISNYQLMEAMIEFCRHNQADEILAHPDVQQRVKRYHEHVPLFKKCFRTIPKSMTSWWSPTCAMWMKYTAATGSCCIRSTLTATSACRLCGACKSRMWWPRLATAF